MCLLLLCKPNPETQYLFPKYVICLNTTKIRAIGHRGVNEPSAPTAGMLGRGLLGFGEMAGVRPRPWAPGACVKHISTFFPSLSLLDITSAVLCCFLLGGRGLISHLSPLAVPGVAGCPHHARAALPAGMQHLPARRAADNEQAIKWLSKKRHRVNAVCCSSSIFINSYIGSSESGSRMKVIAILTQTLKWLICF